MLKLFNSLTRKIEEFKPLIPGRVLMYNCGPTVYGLPHIGNYLSFFRADILRRWLEWSGYEVTQVMNITDIDDKTIRDSKKEGLSLKEFTEKYTADFLRGLDALGIRRAHVYPKATEHVTEMIGIIRKLLAKGYAYKSNDGIYYKISKFKGYGKLSHLNLKGLKAGASNRVLADEYEKESVTDFALWKFSNQDELTRGIYFNTPWGKGRPGWHIECSAMSNKYLGKTFDIHTGGIDLLFPHHENEIAQSEAANGAQFVRYWLHNGHLLVGGEKMSKSKGNYFTLYELLDKFDPLVIRYFFLSTHYRDKVNYTESSMNNAANSLNKLKVSISLAENALKSKDEYLMIKAKDTEFRKAIKRLEKQLINSMDNDLNTPRALMTLHDLSAAINKYVESKPNKGLLAEALCIYKKFLKLFGLLSKEPGFDESLIKAVIRMRDEAREHNDFETSDRIRKLLLDNKIQLEDSPKGTTWRKI